MKRSVLVAMAIVAGALVWAIAGMSGEAQGDLAQDGAAGAGVADASAGGWAGVVWEYEVVNQAEVMWQGANPLGDVPSSATQRMKEELEGMGGWMESRILGLHGRRMKENLNEKGAVGWELVEVEGGYLCLQRDRG